MRIVLLTRDEATRDAVLRVSARTGVAVSTIPAAGDPPNVVVADLDPAPAGDPTPDPLAAFDGPAVPVYVTGVASPSRPFGILSRRPGHLLCRPPADADLDRIIAAARRAGSGPPLAGGWQVIEFGTRVEWIYDAVCHLTRTALPHFPADREPGIRLGLIELVANAIEHGNLGIDKERKHAALREGKPGLERLYRERLERPEIAGRRVRIECRVEPGRCEWRIVDQGRGFDWRSLPDGAGGPAVARMSGRGILLARLQFDEMSYEGDGTSVRAAVRADAAS